MPKDEVKRDQGEQRFEELERQINVLNFEMAALRWALGTTNSVHVAELFERFELRIRELAIRTRFQD